MQTELVFAVWRGAHSRNKLIWKYFWFRSRCRYREILFSNYFRYEFWQMLCGPHAAYTALIHPTVPLEIPHWGQKDYQPNLDIFESPYGAPRPTESQTSPPATKEETPKTLNLRESPKVTAISPKWTLSILRQILNNITFLSEEELLGEFASNHRTQLPYLNLLQLY